MFRVVVKGTGQDAGKLKYETVPEGIFEGDPGVEDAPTAKSQVGTLKCFIYTTIDNIQQNEKKKQIEKERKGEAEKWKAEYEQIMLSGTHIDIDLMLSKDTNDIVSYNTTDRVIRRRVNLTNSRIKKCEKEWEAKIEEHRHERAEVNQPDGCRICDDDKKVSDGAYGWIPIHSLICNTNK